MPDQKPLTALEICDILKACANSGVSKLSFLELVIEFHLPTTAIAGSTTQTQPNTGHVAQDLPQLANSEPDLSPSEPSTQLDVDYLLAVEDPMAFEESQLKELTDARS